jgi:hypothetical protein
MLDVIKDIFSPGPDKVKEAFIGAFEGDFRKFSARLEGFNNAKLARAAKESKVADLRDTNAKLHTKLEAYDTADFPAAIYNQVKNNAGNVHLVDSVASSLAGNFVLVSCYKDILALCDRDLAEAEKDLADWKTLNAKILAEVDELDALEAKRGIRPGQQMTIR